MDADLPVAEALALLALDVRTGRLRTPRLLAWGLAAALIADLALRELLVVRGSTGLELRLAATAIGEPMLDIAAGHLRAAQEALTEAPPVPAQLLELEDRVREMEGVVGLVTNRLLAAAEQRIAAVAAPTTEYWLYALKQRYAALTDDLLDALQQRAILRTERHCLLGLVHRRRIVLVDAAPRAELQTRLRGVALGRDAADAQTTALLSLLYACQLETTLLERAELPLAQAIVQGLVEDDPLSVAVTRNYAGECREKRDADLRR